MRKFYLAGLFSGFIGDFWAPMSWLKSSAQVPACIRRQNLSQRGRRSCLLRGFG